MLCVQIGHCLIPVNWRSDTAAAAPPIFTGCFGDIKSFFDYPLADRKHWALIISARLSQCKARGRRSADDSFSAERLVVAWRFKSNESSDAPNNERNVTYRKRRQRGKQQARNAKRTRIMYSWYHGQWNQCRDELERWKRGTRPVTIHARISAKPNDRESGRNNGTRWSVSRAEAKRVNDRSVICQSVRRYR